ncbi:MAG: hemerythrin domain-containing protein, partial [Rhizomicrobium sp.]
DDTLRAFANVASKILRTTDIIGRWKGGTFSIILPSTGFADAAMVAEKLRLEFSEKSLPFGYRATICLGVAICRSVDTWDLWYDRADAALNMAMSSGCNRLAIENFDNIQACGVQDISHLMQLRWSKAYETGIAHIDAQHKAIFEKANMLFLLGVSETKKDTILALLDPLLTEVQDHLADEEVLLKTVGNYAVQNHIRLHYYLLKRLEDLKSRFRANKIDAAELFHFLMFEYIIQHILIEDLKIFSDIAVDLDAAQRAADQAVNPPSRLTALS